MPQTFSDDKYVYSVDMMFVFLKHNTYPLQKIKVGEYVDVFNYPGWGDPGKGIAYSALDVINNPRRYQDDYKRILQANLSYPIIISADGDIVDGVHRLAKAYLKGKKEIKAYVFDRELMDKDQPNTCI